jgi:two-component system sensor histidine kinase KdpD
VILPFNKLSGFAERVALGDLETPLEYDRGSYFGKFSWAFDSMRSEILKARACEREAIENNKTVIASLSHDIKTPLTMIQGGSNFLYESFGQLEEEEKKGIIKDIYDESCDLSEFVNNLLDMTRLDEENVKRNKVKEAVDDILFEVNEKVKKRLGNKKLIIHNSDEMVFVYADVSLLTQVFVNLIDNAIKHTKNNTVIEVDYQKKENEILFKVKDNGGGIKPEKIEHIFENFYSITANQDRKRNHGLGLGICKTIIEAHEGKIWAYNNEEGGVTFEFTLPLTGE